MKKLLAITAVFCAASLCFSQSVRTAQWYTEAANLSQKAIDLQSNGFYEESIRASEEASKSLDSAIIAATSILMQKRADGVKVQAAKIMESAKKLGAATDTQFKQEFDQAELRYNAADALLPEAAKINQSEQAITQAYQPIIEEFSAVHEIVKRLSESFFTRETSKAIDLINGAKKRYADLSNKKIVVKNSPDDGKITAALTASDSSLQQNNFPAVQTNVQNAMNAMTAAENNFATLLAAAQKTLTDATSRQKQLNTSGVLPANGAENSAVSKSLSDANAALKQSDIATAQKSTTTAVTSMDNAEKAFKAAQAAAQKAITDATAKQKELNTNGILPAGKTENTAVSKLIADANTALKANNTVSALENANKALAVMNEAETAFKNMFTAAQKATSDAVLKQKQLNTNNMLIPQSAEDAGISKLIADANAALKTNNAAVALENANKALENMNAIEQLYLLGSGEAKSLIEAAKTAQTQFTAEYPDAKESDENKAVTSDIQNAETTFAAKEFAQAHESAQKALDELARLLSEYKSRAELYTADGKYKVLPKYYTVVGRTPITVTDCLWRIAQEPFVYGDRNRWQPLYDANKAKLPNPNNPHLIYPGQVFEIPSINGEKRDGVYDPKIQYIDFSDAVKDSGQNARN